MGNDWLKKETKLQTNISLEMNSCSSAGRYMCIYNLCNNIIGLIKTYAFKEIIVPENFFL